MNTQELRKLAESQVGNPKARIILELLDKIDQLQAEKAERETQEPVAYGWQDRNGLIIDCIAPETYAKYKGDYTIPLYLSTGAQPQRCQNNACAKTDANGTFHDCCYPDCLRAQARVPMTELEAMYLLQRCGILGNYKTLEEIVHATEAHHKIGAKE